MPGRRGDPAVLRGNREREPGVAMEPERTRDRHQAIAAHAATVFTRRRGQARGDRVARDVGGQRQRVAHAAPACEPVPALPVVVERVAAAALANGLVVWSNAGHLEDGDGDILMIGPSFTISTDEIDEIVARLLRALEQTLGS